MIGVRGAAGVFVIAFVAVGCGGGDDPEKADATSSTAGASTTEAESVDTSSSAPPTGGGVSDEEFPCTLITTEEMSELAGNPMGGGDLSVNVVDEDGVTYDGPECTWPAVEQGGTEVRLQVSRAEDFPSGTVGCPPPTGEYTDILNLGDSATWSVDSGTELEVGTLRVCTPEAFVQVVADGPVGTGVQAVALAVAQKAIAAIPTA